MVPDKKHPSPSATNAADASFGRRHPTVVTLGGRGVVVIRQTGQAHLPGVSVPVIDTTGAGDAFCGSLAAQLDSGADLLTAARHATAYAAQTVTKHGTISAYHPTSRERADRG
jgi:ribokinase